MQAVAWLVRPLGDEVRQAVAFYDITVVLLGICLVVGVLLMAAVAGPTRRWDALWYAISPAVVLAAYINWDLVAGALCMGMLLAWSRGRHIIAGVLLGLAIATKFYPLMIIGALFLLTLRTARWRPFLVAMAAAAAAWLAVNVPFMVLAWDGWRRFYAFSQERGVDWGSPWRYFQLNHWPILGTADVSLLGTLSLALCCLGIALLVMMAPRRPRLAQICFLALAAFMVTNKVWSPQFVLWLMPFAVLARPNWKPLVLWQFAEVWYFFAIWLYLLSQDPETEYLGISDGVYHTAVWGRAITILIMIIFVVRDILRPEEDLVRQAGVDDQIGGVFDNAPDRFTFIRSARKKQESAAEVPETDAEAGNTRSRWSSGNRAGGISYPVFRFGNPRMLSTGCALTATHRVDDPLLARRRHGQRFLREEGAVTSREEGALRDSCGGRRCPRPGRRRASPR